VDPDTREDLPGGSTSHETTWLLWVLVALAAAPVVVTTISAASQPWLPTSDNAILLLRTLDVPERMPLTGAYSRYGFDHPGPMQFYVLSPFLHAIGPRGMLVGSGMVAAASVAGSVVVAWRRGGPPLALLCAGVLLVLTQSLGSDLVDPWNPLTPVLPFFALALLAWSVTCRDWWALPFTIIAASFAAQAHLAYIPLAGALAATAVGWALVDRWKARRAPTPVAWQPVSNSVLLVTLAVGVLAWAGPLVDQVRPGGGNLWEITHYFVTGDDEADDSYFAGTERAGWGRAAEIVALELSLPAPWMGAHESLDFSTGSVEGAPAWRSVVPAALWAAATGIAWRRRAFAAVRLQFITGGLALIGFTAVSRITGGTYPYLIRWSWAIGALIVLSALWSLVAGSAVERVARAPLPARLVSGAVAAGATLACLSLAGTEAPEPDLAEATRVVVDPVHEAVRDRGRVELDPGPLWEPAAIGTGLLAELERRGVDVTVVDTPLNRLTLRPERTAAEGEADIRVIVAPDTESVPAGAPVVAAHDPLSPDDRAELDELAIGLETFDDLTGLRPGARQRLQDLAARGRSRVVVAVQVLAP
jgi:hypothetical protein